MTKKEFVKRVASLSGTSQVTVNAVLDSIAIVLVHETRDNDERVAIPNLGTFKRKVNKARDGYNPITNEVQHLPESYSIAFRPTTMVRRYINDNEKILAC